MPYSWCDVGNFLCSESFVESDCGVVLEHHVECDGKPPNPCEPRSGFHEKPASTSASVVCVYEQPHRDRQSIDVAPRCLAPEACGVVVGPGAGERDLTNRLAAYCWTHPASHKRETASATFGSDNEAQAWLDAQRLIARTGQNPGQTLEDYIAGLGERWARAIDRTSTYDPYAAGLKLRAVPELGHLPVGMITAGLIDRAIDRWEKTSGHSTVKNTVAALAHVLDDAVRDGLLPRNPAKDRARRKQPGQVKDGSDVNPRDQCWGDMVLLLATTGMRISEVSGRAVGDVDLKTGLIYVRRQKYPGRGGLIVKSTKGRRNCVVPIIEPAQETLERLTPVRRPDDSPLIKGPRGGTITTATLRDTTNWDQLVKDLGIAGLVRHGLRHTALT